MGVVMGSEMPIHAWNMVSVNRIVKMSISVASMQIAITLLFFFIFTTRVKINLVVEFQVRGSKII